MRVRRWDVCLLIEFFELWAESDDEAKAESGEQRVWKVALEGQGGDISGDWVTLPRRLDDNL
jgi:hypothetical protein